MEGAEEGSEDRQESSSLNTNERNFGGYLPSSQNDEASEDGVDTNRDPSEDDDGLDLPRSHQSERPDTQNDNDFTL
jgi:hypothetical protein